MFEAIDLVLAMGFAWMTTGIFLLYINRTRNLTPSWPGNLLLFVFGLTLVDNFIKPGMLPGDVLNFIYIFSRNSYFLIGPFLLFYTRFLLTREKTGLRFLYHLIPFLFMAVKFYLDASSLVPFDELVNKPEGLGIFSNPATIHDIFSILSRGLYSFIVLKLIGAHSRIVPEYYSRKTTRNTLSWLYYLLIIYIILLVFNFIVLITPFQDGFSFRMITINFVRVAPSLFFIFLFSLFAQDQPVPDDKQRKDSDGSEDPQLEKDLKKNVQQLIEIEPVKRKYKTSGLSREETKQLYENLNDFLSQKRLFLDPDLTLNSLASEMGETRHHLSEAINRESGENFYSYINAFRLKEFIISIDEDRFPHFTILAIALECGFKSTSAFYSLFKKNMGMTPRQYIKGNTV